MDDKLKIIIFGLGGAAGSFVLFLVIFWVLLSPKANSAAAATQTVPAGRGSIEANSAYRAHSGRVPGAEAIAYSDVLGENIPLEPEVAGYGWAQWGMSVEDVSGRLKKDGVRDILVYSPDKTDIISVAALNPDKKKFKVEYRFHNNNLFHIEVYYSDFYRNNTFNAFLLSRMSEYGRPYEQYATVDEMGRVILHAKWDTEASLIELASRPNGHFSLFLSSQLMLIRLEEARKTEERLAY